MVCDGLLKGGNWATSAGGWTQISSLADNPNGAGGKGLRQWVGDGQNNNAGGVRVVFNSRQTEIWVRWYMRYESGFKWSPLSYQKMLYFDVGNTGQFYVGWHSFDQMRFRIYGGTGDQISAQGTGWDTVMVMGGDDGNGHKTSDGLFHYFEIHVRKETVGSIDGLAELWVDGVKIFQASNISFAGAGVGWDYFLIPSNQAYPGNGRDMAVDRTNHQITLRDGRSLGYAEYGSPDGKHFTRSLHLGNRVKWQLRF